jgi:hypothetical protein
VREDFAEADLFSRTVHCLLSRWPRRRYPKVCLSTARRPRMVSLTYR